MCRCGAKQDNRPGRQNRLGKKGIAKVVASFLSVKSLIGRFYWEETGDRRGIADPAARIRFYLHKEFRAAEIWFSLHKEFRDGEIIGGRCVRKWRFSKRETAFAVVQIFQEWGNHRGRCVRKWRFSKWETAFAGTQKFPDQFWWVFRYKFFRCQRWRALLMNTWNFRGATL